MKPELQLFERNPIIMAVKDENQLEKAIASDCDILFFLFGNICNIRGLVERARQAGKLTFIHLDLTHGLSSKEIAADFAKEFIGADGVISTRPPHLRRAKAIGLLTVLRVFLVDSLSLANLDKQIDSCDPDLIEILPGVMPKIIHRVSNITKVPVITGGLIFDKEDIISALSAGAQCISTTCERLWYDA
ncbi:MAG: glycerol-3-phosphate responsive antiterminator [Lawsonibacter sp.]|nr:glycerol-3-phosphate responsive antiterminator [Lawsonibacter sp.]